MRGWAKRNREHLRIRGRDYRRNNIEKVRKSCRKAARRRRKVCKLDNASRERREWFMQGDVTRMELIELFEMHNESCYYCKARILRPRFFPNNPSGFDHKIPRSRDGAHTISNMVPCCKTCNATKSTKTPKEYKEYLSHIRKEGEDEST